MSQEFGTRPTNIASVGGTAVGGSTVPVSGTVTANAGSGTMTVDTELPAAAALADSESNPTQPGVAAHLSAFNGASWDRVRVATKGYDMNAVSITSIATVATPTSGKKFRLMSGSISVSAACSVLFEDNSGGNTIYRTPQLLANTPYNFDLGGGFLSAAANNVIKATASTGTVTITGTLRATEE